MAQTIATVDPWSGMIKGTETLRQAANAAEERKLNELKMQAAKQQLAEGEMKLQQQRQAAEDLQARRDLAKRLETARVDVTTPGYGGLADVQAYENAVQANKAQGNLPAIWSDTATAPIPAGGQGMNIPTASGQTAPTAGTPMGRGLSAAVPSVYDQFNQNMAGKPPYTEDQLDALNEKAIAAQQASGLSSYGANTTQRPLSTLEKSQRLASLQQQQGDIEGSLKTVTAGIDITTKVPEAAQKVTTDILTRAYNAVASGVPVEKAKADAVAYAKSTYPPDLIKGIESIQLTPNGIGIIPTTGGIITTTFDPKTGGTKFEFHKTEAKDPFAGGFDVVDAKSRAQNLMRQNPGLTQAAALEQAVSQIRTEKQRDKQTIVQMRIDASGGAGGMGKAQKTDFIDADGTPLNFYSQTGQYLRPDGSAPSQVVKRPPAAVAESAGATTQLINEISSVKNLAKSVTTGPIAGRAGAAAQTVGAASDQFTDLNSKLQNVHNVMLKLRSGQAVTETEYKRFVREFPTVNDPPTVFQRKADNAIKNLQESLAARGQSLQTTGFAAPGTQQRPATGTARPLSNY